MIRLMSDDAMQSVLDKLQNPSVETTKVLEDAIKAYPDDARLHFLLASTHVADGKLIDAHRAFKRSIEIDPNFHIARFQFGFFQLTSGEADNALKTWALLDVLSETHYLKRFVVGLRHLIRDEFPDAISALRKGMEENDENMPLNEDMQKIIDQIEPLVGASDVSTDDEADQSSLTSLLLQQSNQSLH